MITVANDVFLWMYSIKDKKFTKIPGVKLLKYNAFDPEWYLASYYRQNDRGFERKVSAKPLTVYKTSTWYSVWSTVDSDTAALDILLKSIRDYTDTKITKAKDDIDRYTTYMNDALSAYETFSNKIGQENA